MFKSCIRDRSKITKVEKTASGPYRIEMLDQTNVQHTGSPHPLIDAR